MRRLWVAACALALAGAALAVTSPVALARPLPPGVHRAPLAVPRPTSRATPAASPTPSPRAIPAAAPTPAPAPTPPPPNPVVNVTPTQAGPGDTVTVSGSGFPPGTRAQVYLDGPNHPLGPSTVVGGDGTFTTTATIPAGATVDLHQICAQVNTNTPACAQLQITAAATPTPVPTPTPVATPATAAPTATPPTAATPAAAPNGLLASLFPWILIPIAILAILAAIAIVLLVRSRRSRGGGEAAPPPVFGDPRGTGQPTVTHRSPRGYRAPTEPTGGTVSRGYRREGIGAPTRGEPLPGRGDRPGLQEPGDGNPKLPGGGQGWLPEDDRRGLPGGGPASLPPSARPPGLPPGDDDDDPFSTPPRR